MQFHFTSRYVIADKDIRLFKQVFDSFKVMKTLSLSKSKSTVVPYRKQQNYCVLNYKAILFSFNQTIFFFFKEANSSYRYMPEGHFFKFGRAGF